MTLLDDIIIGASGDMPVAKLLRLLKVVASRTRGSGRLDEWVDHELSGYPRDALLPEYRGPFPVLVRGQFLSHLAELSNVPIPSVSWPEHQESSLFAIRLDHPVVELERLASETEPFAFPWSAEAVLAYNYGLQHGQVIRIVREDLNLGTAYRHVGRDKLVGAVDAVRTRVLDLALELEKVAPEAGQANADDLAKIDAAQVIHNYSFYGSSNVAIDSSDFAQHVSVTKGDEASLLEVLGRAGISAEMLAQLRQALAADRTEAGGAHPPSPGRRVRAWMIGATAQVGMGAAAGALTNAISAFFGG